MNRVVYLDNSATTQVDPQVVAAMVEMMEADYGNPSSLHRMGVVVEKRMNKAREQVAKALGAKSKEIIFTSGGTEANNLAIRGVAHQYQNRGRHLITTTIEHPSVLHTFKRLEAEGYTVTYIKPDKEGFIAPENVVAAVTKETILVSVMHVNNEMGAVEPVATLGTLLKAQDARILFHVDAVQSFGKFALNPAKMKIDLLTVSGHKIHGPKGIGALYMQEKLRLKPLFEGGGQERDIRSGTENIPGIVGLGLAAELIEKKQLVQQESLRVLKAWFMEEVQRQIPDVKINGPQSVDDLNSGKSAPHIINLSFPGLKAEVLLHALEDVGIFVSTGSACHSRQSAPSHVLVTMGLKPREIEGALRLSMSYHTTREDLQYVLEYLPKLVAELRTLMRK